MIGSSSNRLVVIDEKFTCVSGFIHEHQRPDRDEYIDILYENIANDRGSLDVDNKYNLDKQKDFPYDFCSVAHYSRFTGSRVSTAGKKNIHFPIS